MNKNKTFINKANIIHNNIYDYSNIDYINAKIKIKINCNNHGVFIQRPDHHLGGSGCPKCNGGVKFTKNDFINKSNNIHKNKYDYLLSDYKNNKTIIKIKCVEHGIFKQKAMHHLNGSGCPKCNNVYHKKTIDFIEESNIKHNNKYNYSKTKYINAKTKIEIICKKHNSFFQTPNNHLSSLKGCPKCKTSKGENKIRDYLEKNNIKFEEQKTFNDLKSINKLKYDFYLPEHNTCIEYDGKQHFKVVEYFGGRSGFMKRKHRDKIKNQYCLDNNIKLIRIPYTDFDNIKNILSDFY